MPAERIRKLIKTLKELSIEHVSIQVGQADGESAVVVTCPMDVTFPRIRTLYETLELQNDFKVDLLVAGNNRPVSLTGPPMFKLERLNDFTTLRAIPTERSKKKKKTNFAHHLEALVAVLHSLTTLAGGHHLLSLKPCSTCISVHTACPSKQDKGTISILEEFTKADVVYTGAAALRQCARLWRWNTKIRIPFTFPLVTTKRTDYQHVDMR